MKMVPRRSGEVPPMSTMTSFSVVLQPDVARRLVAAAAVAGVSDPNP